MKLDFLETPLILTIISIVILSIMTTCGDFVHRQTDQQQRFQLLQNSMEKNKLSIDDIKSIYSDISHISSSN